MRPLCASKLAMAARGSIALGAKRVSISRTRSTCAARANAVSTAAISPSSQSSAILPGALCQIVRRVLRHSTLHVRRRGERVEFDLDCFGCVARLVRRLRNHNGDGFADVPNALHCQHWHSGLEHRLAVATVEGRDWRNVADAVGREIAARDRGDDAWHLGRRHSVHLANDGMGDGCPRRTRRALGQRRPDRQ